MIDGFIFRADNKIFEEAIAKNLFGEQEYYLPLVKEIQPGTTIFLYNTQTQKINGPFQAQGAGDKYLDPSAFSGMYPAQVRVKRTETIKSIDASELSEIIGFRGVFPDSELDAQKLKKTLTLFK